MSKRYKFVNYIIFSLSLLICQNAIFADSQPRDSITLAQNSLLKSNKDIVTILAIDGGGIRGIIPLHVLKYLEQKTGRPISDMFDVIAGTSTGAIISASISLPNQGGQQLYNSSDILNLYNTYGPQIFYANWWHKLTSLNGLVGPKFTTNKRDNFYHKLFHDINLSQLRGHVILSSYDLMAKKPYFFKNWQAKTNPNENFKMYDVIEGATSALSFFPPKSIYSNNNKTHDVLLDAGMFINNPALRALLTAQQLYPGKRYLLVSLGTGLHIPRLTLYQINVKDQKWGLLQSAKVGIILSMQASSENVDNELQKVYQTKGNGLPGYFRYNIAIDKADEDPFNGNKSNIISLNQYGNKLVQQNLSSLNMLAEILKKHNQQRALA